MNRYTVTCVYRRSNGLDYNFPTDRTEVIVEAETPEAARAAAIDMVYQQAYCEISHVRPSRGVLVT